MLVNLIIMAASLVVGAALTFLVSRHYYLKASKELLQESERLRNLTNLVIRGLNNAGLVEYKWDEKGEPTGLVIKLAANIESRLTMRATSSVVADRKDIEQSKK